MKRIYFTGTGPGNPELLTRKAVRTILQNIPKIGSGVKNLDRFE